MELARWQQVERLYHAALGISLATAERDWYTARAWSLKELRPHDA